MGIGLMLDKASGVCNSTILYHGTSAILGLPKYGVGKADNDYGSGFYLTESFERAAEWACEFGDSDAYVNEYELNISNLNILHFNKLGPLAWIAEVGSHRYKSVGWEKEFVDRFIAMYKPDTDYDVIVGLRADDAYMRVIDTFFQNKFGAFEIENLFGLGDLGEQYFLKSQRAFDALRFIKRTDVNGFAFNDISFREKAISAIERRDRDLLLNRNLIIQYPTMMDAIERKLIYNSEGFYE